MVLKNVHPAKAYKQVPRVLPNGVFTIYTELILASFESSVEKIKK